MIAKQDLHMSMSHSLDRSTQNYYPIQSSIYHPSVVMGRTWARVVGVIPILVCGGVLVRVRRGR